MARVNIDILGVSELRWTGMGEFNSDDHYIYYCGQESAHRMISVCFQGKPFYIRVIQVYAPISNAEEAEVELFCEDLQDLLALIPKRCPLYHRGLECRSWKSNDTWKNRQVWPWNTKWTRAKANRVLSGETLVITYTLFQQYKRWLYTWVSPDGQYRNQIDYNSLQL